MLEVILKYLGAGDQALMVMGPILTIFFAWLFGGSLTQFLKFPLAKTISDGWYDWAVRAFSAIATAIFAHVLSDSLHWSLEIGVGFTQPIAYKVGLAVLRHYWPWLEASKYIGAVNPPAVAMQAAAQRAADRSRGQS